MEKLDKNKKGKHNGKLFVVNTDHSEKIYSIPVWSLEGSDDDVRELTTVTDLFVKPGTFGIIIDSEDMDFAKVLINEKVFYMHWVNIKLSF